jgi:nucleoprotein TPR
MADGAVLAVALPPDLDAGALAELLPDVSLDALTSDSALALFELVLAQATALDERQREADDARAELARRDVELEQAYQDRDVGARELETQLAETQRTLAETKTRHDALRACSPACRRRSAGGACSCALTPGLQTRPRPSFAPSSRQ